LNAEEMSGLLERVNYFRSSRLAAGAAEAGQTLVEYSLLLALFSVALVGALGAYRNGLSVMIQGIVDALEAII
jgi:Flp pilus assembly pilin Flp